VLSAGRWGVARRRTSMEHWVNCCDHAVGVRSGLGFASSPQPTTDVLGQLDEIKPLQEDAIARRPQRKLRWRGSLRGRQEHGCPIQSTWAASPMGSAAPCSEARLHSAERVYRDVHPGLARSRRAQCNGFTPFANEIHDIRSWIGCADGTYFCCLTKATSLTTTTATINSSQRTDLDAALFNPLGPDLRRGEEGGRCALQLMAPTCVGVTKGVVAEKSCCSSTLRLTPQSFPALPTVDPVTRSATLHDAPRLRAPHPRCGDSAAHPARVPWRVPR
jgi:hypothetical protein